MKMQDTAKICHPYIISEHQGTNNNQAEREDKPRWNLLCRTAFTLFPFWKVCRSIITKCPYWHEGIANLKNVMFKSAEILLLSQSHTDVLGIKSHCIQWYLLSSKCAAFDPGQSPRSEVDSVRRNEAGSFRGNRGEQWKGSAVSTPLPLQFAQPPLYSPAAQSIH